MKKSTSERLKILLEMENISQIEFANKIGLGKSTVSQYISGKRLPKQNILTLISEKFNVNEAWLMGYDVSIEKDLITNTDAILDAKISNDKVLKEAIKKYYSLSEDKQKQIIDFINFISKGE